MVGIVRDGEDVRRSFSPLLASVGINNFLVVHWQPLVGIDSDTEQPRVGLKRHVQIHYEASQRGVAPVTPVLMGA